MKTLLKLLAITSLVAYASYDPKPLGIADGGTGQITAAAAATAILPSQGSNGNKVLSSNGTSASWNLLVNANLDAAAGVARSKLASGTADHVIINDGSGVLSSEATLAISRGGTGQATASAAINALVPSQGGNTGEFLTTDGSVVSWAPVTASSVGFDGITTGSNTTATMTVGTGASIVPAGSGAITSTLFVGSGSTTSAVDLATAEAAGTLPVSKGGTNATSYTEGSVNFAGASGTSIAQDNASLFYDDASDILIVGGNSAPGAQRFSAKIGAASGSTPIGVFSASSSSTNNPAAVSVLDGTRTASLQVEGASRTGVKLTNAAGSSTLYHANGGGLVVTSFSDFTLLTGAAPATVTFSDSTGVFSNTGALQSNTSLILQDPGVGTNTITIDAGVPTASYSLTLPVDDGTSGQVLSTNGTGVLSWVSGASSAFNDITSGTNTTATMTVGNGASVVPTGTGIITATRMVGSGSSTNAVDLATAEVAGVLPIANGGTGSSTDVVSFTPAGGSPNSTGAVVSGGTITLQPADATNQGLLSISAQTVAGVKTFNATPLLKTALNVEDPGVGTNKVTIQSPTLSGDYTLTLPVDDGAAGQALITDGSGVLSFGATKQQVVNPGNADYTILAQDQHLRSGTTLTADRTWTLPPCASGNIGETHYIKKVDASAFNIIVEGNSTDTIDGSLNKTISVQYSGFQFVCAVAGAWDVQ